MATLPHVFVSHSHEDNAWCSVFVQTLRQAGADGWYDEENLGWGVLREEIERQLLDRPIFIVVLSPSAVASKWVQREVDAAIFLQDQEKSQRVILPVEATKCAIPLLWTSLRRLSASNDDGLSAREAAERVLHMLSSTAGEAPLASNARGGAPIRGGEEGPGPVPRPPHEGAGAADAPQSSPSPLSVASSGVRTRSRLLAAAEGGWHQIFTPKQTFQLFSSEDVHHAITDIYDEDRRAFLVWYPTPLIVGLTVAGLLTYLLTGLLGYQGRPDTTPFDAIFRFPWPLYTWLCALVVTFQISILRHPALRRQLVSTLGVTLACASVVGGVYYLRQQVSDSLSQLHLGVVPLFGSGEIAHDRWTYTVINFGCFALYWAFALRRWIRRMRGSAATVRDDQGAAATAEDMRAAYALGAGDLLLGGLLALLLALALRSDTIGFLSGMVGIKAGVDNCTVAWPLGSCGSPGGGIADAPTLTFADLIQALVYLENSVLIFLLVALSLGAIALRKSLWAALEHVMESLLALVFNGFGLVPALGRVGWQLSILVGTVALALTAQETQSYLHALVGGCGAPICLIAPAVQQTQLLAYGLAAVIAAVVAVLSFALAPALLLHRSRVVSNALRFVFFVGFVLLLTAWLFTLSVSGLNWLLVTFGVTSRVPFATLGTATYMSLASLLVFSVLLIVRRSRPRS